MEGYEMSFQKNSDFKREYRGFYIEGVGVKKCDMHFINLYVECKHWFAVK